MRQVFEKEGEADFGCARSAEEALIFLPLQTSAIQATFIVTKPQKFTS